MSISSQLPQVVTAARSGALQALALQAGQTLVGTVIGPAPNGGTQVQISGQMLNLLLPALAKAGETLKFEVQGSGAQLRLALQPTTAPSTAPTAPSPTPLPAQAAPLPLPPSAVPAQAAAPATAQPAALPTAQGPIVATSANPQPSATTAASPSAPTTAAAPLPPVAAPLPGAIPAAPSLAAPPNASLPNTAVAAVPSSPASGGTAQAQSSVQPYPQALPNSAAGARPPAAAVPLAATASQAQSGATPAAQTTVPPPSPPMPLTPQAALAQMVQASVPGQGAVTALTTALSSIAGKVVLPEPVARAAQQVLAGRLTVATGKVDGASLQKAVLNSGLFQEAALLRGSSNLTQPDMKSSLLALRQTLTAWLGQQAPITPLTHIAPPMRGAIPRAKGTNAPPIDPAAAPEEIGKQLLDRTESALSRLRLHQNASLPDAAAKAGTDWSMDLPVLIGTHQTLMQLQIHRDQQGSTDDPGERGWQMRFAINLPGMGEVGAQVSLRGAATGIMLWANERAASEALEAEIVSLRETLVEAGLKPGAIVVRHGEPPAPPAPSGHFVDART